MKDFDPIYWRHAIWKACSGAVLVAGGAAPTVILGWDTMILSGKIVACLGIFMSVIKSLDMFFDTTMNRLAAGKLPVKLDGQNGVDTAHLKKSDVNPT